MRYLMAFLVCAAVLSAGPARADSLLETPNTGMVGAQRLGSTEIQNPPYATFGLGQNPHPVDRRDVAPLPVEPVPPPAPVQTTPSQEAPLPDEVDTERFEREPVPEPTIREMP